ncbi:hypothetical protein ACLB2K_050563 [Fragaria x ananassa]
MAKGMVNWNRRKLGRPKRSKNKKRVEEAGKTLAKSGPKRSRKRSFGAQKVLDLDAVDVPDSKVSHLTVVDGGSND